MTQKFPYTITKTNITVFCSGQVIKMPSTHGGFIAMAEHLQGETHDINTIMELSDKRAVLEKLMGGKISIVGGTVYYKGVPVRTALAERLVMLTEMGHDATPWGLFMGLIEENPSENSRLRLFEFIDRWETPLTPDGHFIAFKGVNNDYSSSRTDPQGNKVYNRPGDVVKMPREEVEEDPNVTCASGLHACASHYLDSFWGTQYKVIAVKINPRDVVSIPSDYNLSKMRVCRYEVLGDIVDQRHRERVENAQIIDKNDAGVLVERLGAVAEIHAKPEIGVSEQHIFEGAVYVETDEDIDIGSIAISNEAGLIGLVTEYDNIRYYDEEHPDFKAWQNGEKAGGHCTDLLMATIKLSDGVCVTHKWDENRAVWPFTALKQVMEDLEEDWQDEDLEEDWQDEDEDDDVTFILEQAMRVDVPSEDEQLVFEHAVTGRTFTATQLIDEVTTRGQRGFERTFGIPRTTIQDWVRRAHEQGY